MCISIKDGIQVIKLSEAFFKAWRPCHHISIRKHISQLLSKASAVRTWALCKAQTLLLTFMWSKSSRALELFNFDYELLEKPAAIGNPFAWRLTHRLCCDYNDFFKRWPQGCGLSCGVLQGLCANLFSLTKTHLIANHGRLKQSCGLHALYYTITSLTYQAWLFPQVIIFHSLISEVLTKDRRIWSRLPGSSFNAAQDLLPPSVLLLFNHEAK